MAPKVPPPVVFTDLKHRPLLAFHLSQQFFSFFPSHSSAVWAQKTPWTRLSLHSQKEFAFLLSISGSFNKNPLDTSLVFQAHSSFIETERLSLVSKHVTHGQIFTFKPLPSLLLLRLPRRGDFLESWGWFLTSVGYSYLEQLRFCFRDFFSHELFGSQVLLNGKCGSISREGGEKKGKRRSNFKI